MSIAPADDPYGAPTRGRVPRRRLSHRRTDRRRQQPPQPRLRPRNGPIHCGMVHSTGSPNPAHACQSPGFGRGAARCRASAGITAPASRRGVVVPIDGGATLTACDHGGGTDCVSRRPNASWPPWQRPCSSSGAADIGDVPDDRHLCDRRPRRLELPDARNRGSRGNPLDVPDGTNAPANIGGRDFSGHALDRMRRQGITPSVVENTITPGNVIGGKVPGTTAYYDSVNHITVVTDTGSGRVVTADFGRINQ